MTGRKLRLAASAVLLVGWLGWLGYTALTKNRGPVVSRAQAAAATLAVVAEVPAGEGPRVVEVKDVLAGTLPGGSLTVTNLGEAAVASEEIDPAPFARTVDVRLPGPDGRCPALAPCWRACDQLSRCFNFTRRTAA